MYIKLFTVVFAMLASGVLQDGDRDEFYSKASLGTIDMSQMAKAARFGLDEKTWEKIDRKCLTSSLIDMFPAFADNVTKHVIIESSQLELMNEWMKERKTLRENTVREVFDRLLQTDLSDGPIRAANTQLQRRERENEDQLIQKIERELDPSQVDQLVLYLVRHNAFTFGKVDFIAKHLNLSAPQRALSYRCEDETYKTVFRRLKQGVTNPGDLAEEKELTRLSIEMVEGLTRAQFLVYARATNLVDGKSTLEEHYQNVSPEKRKHLADMFHIFREIQKELEPTAARK